MLTRWGALYVTFIYVAMSYSWCTRNIAQLKLATVCVYVKNFNRQKFGTTT